MAATLLAALTATGLVVACSPPPRLDRDPAARLTVFAAASLRDPLAAIATAYEAARHVRLLVATDSSTVLRIQIEQGADADVFLSADTANPEALASAGLLDGKAIGFAANPLAIVVPAGNPAGLASPADLGRPGVAVVAAGEAAPIAAYAAKLLERLAALPGYPPDLPVLYAANVVTREDNVQAVLAKIELGEGDTAIVYATNAASSKTVETLPIPAVANVTATYAGAVLAGAGDRAAAHAFLDWLAGPDGQEILASFGFLGTP